MWNELGRGSNIVLCVLIWLLFPVVEETPALRTQSDLTQPQTARHAEYFHCDSANLTPGVSQQTGVKVKKTKLCEFVCVRF